MSVEVELGPKAKFGAGAQYRQMISRSCGELRYHGRQTRQEEAPGAPEEEAQYATGWRHHEVA